MTQLVKKVKIRLLRIYLIETNNRQQLSDTNIGKLFSKFNMSLQDPFNHTGLFTKCSGTKIRNGVSSKATNERTDGVKLFDIPAKC